MAEKIYNSIKEMFAEVERQDNKFYVVGMTKIEDGRYYFAPNGCGSWLEVSEDEVSSVKFLRHVPCDDDDKDAHSHPLVEIAFEADQTLASRVLKSLVSRDNKRSRSSNPMRGTESRRGFSSDAPRRRNRSQRLNADCPHGYGPCGGWNSDWGVYCNSEERPCYGYEHTSCEEFPECL